MAESPEPESVSSISVPSIPPPRSSSSIEQERKELLLTEIRDAAPLARIRQLVEGDVNLDFKDSDGDTALHVAALRGEGEVVEILLTAGAAIEASGHEGNRPLHVAAIEGKQEVVSILLAAGADKEAKNQYRNTPLHLAAFYGQEEVLKKLLAAGARIDVKGENGFTPLHLAARKGKQEVVKVLLDEGAATEAKDRHGKTSLHLAALNGQEEVLKKLLAAGAATEVKDHDLNTPLHLAAIQGYTEVAKVLLQEGAATEATAECRNTSLHLAAINGQTEVAKVLLQEGAAIEAKNQYGNRPLHLAALNGQEEVLKTLLAAGAQIEARGEAGFTPLYCAAVRGEEGTVRVLLENGADISARSDSGDTPRDAAERNKKENVLDLIDNPPLVAVPRLSLMETSQPSPSEKRSGRKRVCQDLFAHVTYWYNNKLYSAHLEKPKYTVYDVIYGSQLEDISLEIYDKTSKAQGETSVGFRWIHLPVNNKIWHQHLIEKLCAIERRQRSYCQHIQNFVKTSFYEHGGSTDHSYFIRPTCQVFNQNDKRDLGDHVNVLSFAMPYLIAETTAGQEELKLAIRSRNQEGAGHAGNREATAIENLYQQYDIPLDLHIPRTLDQFYYHELNSTDMRDSDQVVYRFTRLQEEARNNTHPSLKIGQRKTSAQVETKVQSSDNSTTWAQQASGVGVKPSLEKTAKEARAQLLMVNQIWLMMIDEKTVVTFFPQSSDQSGNQNLLIGSIRRRYKHSPISSASELVALIATQCSGLIDPPDNGGLEHSLFHIFASSIAVVAYKVARLYGDFHKVIQENQKITIGTEMDLLVEIKDIQDELGMIRKVLEEQDETIGKLPDVLGGEDVYSDLDDFKRDAAYRIRTVKSQIEDARGVESSLNHLLDLKQKQVNINEAISSRKQAENTAMQGNYILVFTVVTIIFSPLSFMSGLFALDISSFPHDNTGNVKLDNTWVSLRMAFGTIGTLLLVVLGVILAHHLSRARESTTATATKVDLELQLKNIILCSWGQKQNLDGDSSTLAPRKRNWFFQRSPPLDEESNKAK